MNVELAWYLTVDSLVSSMVVIVINETLDFAVDRGSVFLWLDANILVFYRFPKSFNPNLVFGTAAFVHAKVLWELEKLSQKKFFLAI